MLVWLAVGVALAFWPVAGARPSGSQWRAKPGQEEAWRLPVSQSCGRLMSGLAALAAPQISGTSYQAGASSLAAAAAPAPRRAIASTCAHTRIACACRAAVGRRELAPPPPQREAPLLSLSLSLYLPKKERM